MDISVIPSGGPTYGLERNNYRPIPQDTGLGELALIALYGRARSSTGSLALVKYDEYSEVFFVGKWTGDFYFTCVGSERNFFLGKNAGYHKPLNSDETFNFWDFSELSEKEFDSITQNPNLIDPLFSMEEIVNNPRKTFRVVEAMNAAGELISVTTKETSEYIRRIITQVLAERNAS